MGDSNPFTKMTWDGSGFKTAKEKVNESFDALIAGAGNQQAMATGMAGGQSSRVAAETYVNAAGQRNQSEAQILGQEASAKSQFEQNKQQKIAEWDAQQASPLDFIFNTVIPAGTGIASMFFPPAAIGTIGSKLAGSLTGGGNKPGPVRTSFQETSTNTTMPSLNLGSKFNSGNIQTSVGSNSLPNYSAFKIKEKTPLNFIKPF